ncbi:hypothetical protein WJX84_007612 [Apatococcus fuscideae]|uniref:Centrosomal protein of 70 kDa n=1 Tax=Apatococcus fuscideae TaxID=2026836 RepID=A0AAW1STQ9_9CHLO
MGSIFKLPLFVIAGPRARSVRQQVQRDKEVHRLGLASIEKLHPDVLIDVVQDVCIAMEVSDAMQLPGALHKLLQAVAAIPKLERFVGDVCEVVFEAGRTCLPDMSAKPSAGAVPGILQAWLALLQGLPEMRKGLAAIGKLLSARPGSDPISDTNLDCGRLVVGVRALVEGEQAWQASSELVSAAEGLIASEPQGLLQRVIAHFQHLFSCSSLDAVLPTMSQIYVTCSEAGNFRRSLACLLGLAPDAPYSASMQRVRQLLDRHSRELGLKEDYIKGMEPASPSAGKENKAWRPGHGGWPEVEIRLPHGMRPGPEAKQQGSPAGPQPAAKEAASKLTIGAKTEPGQLHELAKLFGVQKPEQVLEQARKLEERLRRLDEVVPKYQKLASQLMDILCVQSLEQIYPCIQKMLKQQPSLLSSISTIAAIR